MSVVNVEVKPAPYESIEKTLRRFNKKCKKEDIVKEYCEKSRFKTKRQKLKEKSAKSQRNKEKYDF